MRRCQVTVSQQEGICRLKGKVERRGNRWSVVASAKNKKRRHEAHNKQGNQSQEQTHRIEGTHATAWKEAAATCIPGEARESGSRLLLLILNLSREGAKKRKSQSLADRQQDLTQAATQPVVPLTLFPQLLLLLLIHTLHLLHSLAARKRAGRGTEHIHPSSSYLTPMSARPEFVRQFFFS